MIGAAVDSAHAIDVAAAPLRAVSRPRNRACADVGRGSVCAAALSSEMALRVHCAVAFAARPHRGGRRCRWGGGGAQQQSKSAEVRGGVAARTAAGEGSLSPLLDERCTLCRGRFVSSPASKRSTPLLNPVIAHQ